MNAKSKRSIHEEASEAFAVGVAFGRCTQWLETYSERTGIPLPVLSARVAILIYNGAGGEGSGLPEHMPALRRNAAEGDGDGSGLPSPHLDDDPHGQTRKATRRYHRGKLTASTRRSIAVAQRQRWAKRKATAKTKAQRRKFARMYYRVHYGKKVTPQQKKAAMQYLERRRQQHQLPRAA